jgi:hypothetical protein
MAYKEEKEIKKEVVLSDQEFREIQLEVKKICPDEKWTSTTLFDWAFSKGGGKYIIPLGVKQPAVNENFSLLNKKFSLYQDRVRAKNYAQRMELEELEKIAGTIGQI